MARMMSYEANNKGTNSLINYSGAPRAYNSEPVRAQGEAALKRARVALELS